MSPSRLFPGNTQVFPRSTQPSATSGEASWSMQRLHRPPRLLDPSGSRVIPLRHGISAKLKQRPWKTCQKPHISHMLRLFLRKRNQGLTESETTICRVWPNPSAAVVFSTNAGLGVLITQNHTGWGWQYLRKLKSVAERRLLPDSFRKSAC